MSGIGVVTGSRLEARCLTRLEVRIACTGADAKRAHLEAKRLIEDGVRGLVSFGVAGALDPGLRPGDLLLPEAVLTHGGERIQVDTAWCARLVALVQNAGLDARADPLIGSNEPIRTTAAKAELRRVGAIAVDMESHAVALAAHAAGLPFVVIRAVADPADQALPAAARVALDDEGRLRPHAVALALLWRPGEAAALLRLAWASRAGLRTLRRVAALAGAPLALG